MQRLKELENSLHRVYLKVYRQIKKEPDYPDNLSAIQRKYNKIVYDNTRSAIQQAVLYANEKVNRLFKTQPYLTQSDLDIIKKQSKEQTDSFWRKIMLDIFRKQEQRLMGGASSADTVANLDGQVEDDASPQPPPDLDLSAYLLAVATASLFGAFASATLSKTGELADTVIEKPKVKWKATIDQKTCKELPDGSAGCGSRNGNIYETDDADLLEHMPGTGTHNYCRCYLEPVILL
ncbi:MAG TPA: hypothetical protein VLG09_01885 [Candidatus Saccharimonadales bacterium]|nr:hypothetical protein [Candidatus Saccharimonadales bacterium]